MRQELERQLAESEEAQDGPGKNAGRAPFDPVNYGKSVCMCANLFIRLIWKKMKVGAQMISIFPSSHCEIDVSRYCCSCPMVLCQYVFCAEHFNEHCRNANSLIMARMPQCYRPHLKGTVTANESNKSQAAAEPTDPRLNPPPELSGCCI